MRKALPAFHMDRDADQVYPAPQARFGVVAGDVVLRVGNEGEPGGGYDQQRAPGYASPKCLRDLPPPPVRIGVPTVFPMWCIHAGLAGSRSAGERLRAQGTGRKVRFSCSLVLFPAPVCRIPLLSSRYQTDTGSDVLSPVQRSIVVGSRTQQAAIHIDRQIDRYSSLQLHRSVFDPSLRRCRYNVNAYGLCASRSMLSPVTAVQVRPTPLSRAVQRASAQRT